MVLPSVSSLWAVWALLCGSQHARIQVPSMLWESPASVRSLVESRSWPQGRIRSLPQSRLRMQVLTSPLSLGCGRQPFVFATDEERAPQGVAQSSSGLPHQLELCKRSGRWAGFSPQV